MVAPAVVQRVGPAGGREHCDIFWPLSLVRHDLGEKHDVVVIEVAEDGPVADAGLALPPPQPDFQIPICVGLEATDQDVGLDLSVPESHVESLSL